MLWRPSAVWPRRSDGDDGGTTPADRAWSVETWGPFCVPTSYSPWAAGRLSSVHRCGCAVGPSTWRQGWRCGSGGRCGVALGRPRDKPRTARGWCVKLARGGLPVTVSGAFGAGTMAQDLRGIEPEEVGCRRCGARTERNTYLSHMGFLGMGHGWKWLRRVGHNSVLCRPDRAMVPRGALARPHATRSPCYRRLWRTCRPSV